LHLEHRLPKTSFNPQVEPYYDVILEEKWTENGQSSYAISSSLIAIFKQGHRFQSIQDGQFGRAIDKPMR
jgi:hypothetical protein